jgi:hypothetical protein
MVGIVSTRPQSEKTNLQQNDWGHGSSIQRLPNKGKALSSISSAKKKGKRKEKKNLRYTSEVYVKAYTELTLLSRIVTVTQLGSKILHVWHSMCAIIWLTISAKKCHWTGPITYCLL